MPFDRVLRDKLKVALPRIKSELIAEVDKDFGVYVKDAFNTR